jgi:hypothetical protein
MMPTGLPESCWDSRQLRPSVQEQRVEAEVAAALPFFRTHQALPKPRKRGSKRTTLY